jgi:hypothetical protein
VGLGVVVDSLGPVQPPSNRLRATRATPPGLASGDDDRRAIYGAALQQFDDLFAAARAIGPVSRPLPLYYAVHQAGKAIAAAWVPRDFRPRIHGLTEHVPDESSQWKDNVLLFRVKPQRQPGVFGAVASALGTARLTSSAEIGALWSALPEVSPPASPGSWPLALPVYPRAWTNEGVAWWVSVGLRGQQVEDAVAVDRLLATYPDADGAVASTFGGELQFDQTPRGPGVGVHLEVRSMQAAEEPSGLYAPRRAAEYWRAQERWLVPVVGETSDRLPPVLIWWVLLFGLSLLARYEPVAWQAALDLDHSRIADPLTKLLDDALEIVPDLLFAAATAPR